MSLGCDNVEATVDLGMGVEVRNVSGQEKVEESRAAFFQKEYVSSEVSEMSRRAWVMFIST
jgi:hypothetical protein